MKLRSKITIAIACLLALCAPVQVLAVGQTSSSNYALNEVFFGSGGELNACGTAYCTKQSAGELTVGNSQCNQTTTPGCNSQIQAGFNTDRTPYIQMTVTNNTTNLGTLSPTTTATATANFQVETYLAHGYAVENGSPPPANGSYTINTLTTPTASTAGTEQFGINLVANTTPACGANISYTPSSGIFSHGIVDSSYSTPNEFLYNEGDTIALSTQSTSYTNYTICYIFNISHVTPGGTYNFNHVLIVTGTY